MTGSKLGGIALLVVGICVLAYAIDRACFHPTRADRERMARIADHGPYADPGTPLKLYLLGGVAITGWGIKKISGEG